MTHKSLFEIAFNRTLETVRARSSSAPTGLLHFTDATGLLSILREKRIRLTRAKCLNDSLEIAHGLGVAAKALKSALSGKPGQNETLMLEEALRFVNSSPTDLEQEGLPFLDAHVACFCEDTARNSLLHWGLYGRQGEGYALAFDAAGLVRLRGPDLFKVEYDDEKQSIEMKTAVEHFLRALRRDDGVRELSEAHLGPAYVGAFCGYALIQLASAMKHHTFSSENEWRLVGQNSQHESFGGHDMKLRFHVAGNQIRSAFEWDFAETAVKEVLTGSRVDHALAEPTLRMLLRDLKYVNVSVAQTNLSLR